ncbi:MAG: porin [Gammaproteobacteria bacterium]|nr:porin [Gammaproteobacteria bacterium]
MKHVIKTTEPRAANGGGNLVWCGAVLAGALSLSGAVRAQSTAAPAADDSLTFHGITLYGIVDLGLQYQTHGAPINDYYPAGSADIVQKNSNKSVFGVTPSNMSQSRVGLQGVEPVVGDWSAVFKLETFFNPQSGDISDGLKSQVQNNGRALASQSTNLDSSVAGQIFQQSYAGFSSPTFGTVTFGRQNTLLADGVAKYDPNYASQAFSLIGLSGTAAGGGDTQDRRLDESVKYVLSYAHMIHAGAQFKFNQATGGANTAVEADIGGEYAGASVDAYYVKVKDAVSTSSLSAAQVALLPALGFSPNNSLAGTISDNTTFGVMGLYNMGAPKFFFGYEHIRYANPSTPLAAGFDDIGGYKLAFVNNAAFPTDKILQVYWAGVKYTLIPELDLTAAYYGYHQNSYGTGANAGCSGVQAGTCSGTLDAYSIDADYRLTKRFDAYAGVMYTGVHNGLANGYLHTTDMNPTIGIRYKF